MTKTRGNGGPRDVPPFDMFAGLSGLELEHDSYDLGEGVTIRKTYGHLMAPFTMAFKRPAAYDEPHPGPWKSLGGGFAFDIESEIQIPASVESGKHSQMDIGKAMLFLLRLGVHPGIQLPVFANAPFSAMADLPERRTWLRPFDFFPRFFPLDIDFETFGKSHAEYVRDRWKTVLRLRRADAAFALAADAIDQGQFVQNTALTLVSLWGALEALFSPSTSELKFRVSSMIAAYLEPPGANRLALQRSVAKLYDKRSAAAHGKPSHDNDHLLETFNLLQRVLLQIIDRGAVPGKDELEQELFGATS
ncbi:HEPN domain-containing protein [Sphingomonas sp.]|uniref:Uncharacterized protein n=1 Tax=Variovorax paradoxus TaxID=34073 RepID=A0A2W5QD85_VARPD|nr:HEPN domain-containing protein [Sphingomonas sp.]PZQ76401.1 MAG: hypothetical protein DI563_07175 [Variovorax paradoxus]